MQRLTKKTGLILFAALMAGSILWASPVQADTAEAELHPVDAGTGRVSSRAVGYLRFSEGEKADQVKILIHIQNLTVVQGEQPLTTVGGASVYEHGLRIRSSGDCSNTEATDSQAGVLPQVGIRQDGNAVMAMTASGITLKELPGKSVVLYRGDADAKRQIIACGVIKKD